MAEPTIATEEVLYRRIPPGKDWFEPPDRITSANFKLGKNKDGTREEGLSVYRASFVTPAEVLRRPGVEPGTRVAWAKAGSVRTLEGGNKKPLKLEVVVSDDENDPGHAEIRGPEPRKLSNSASNALRKLFQLIPDTASIGPPAVN